MLQDFILTFTTIFVSMDVIGMLPIYLGMTRGMDETKRRKIVHQSMFVAFAVAVVFMIGGRALFQFLGITLGDFKIAGGIILLLIALADLLGGPESMHKESGSTGVVPLAVPLISGPAVLTALVIRSDREATGYLVTLAALVLNYLFAWVVLIRSDLIQRAIGKDGTVVVSKIAALLLAAIAVSMIRSGVVEAITAVSAGSR